MKQLFNVVVEKVVTETYVQILANSPEEAENIAETLANEGDSADTVEIAEVVTVQAIPVDEDAETETLYQL
jgi:hypothetical protein